MEGEVRTPEEFKRFIAETRAALEEAKKTGDVVKEVSTRLPQLTLAIEGLQRNDAENRAYTPDGTEADVVRSYTLSSANREDLPLASGRHGQTKVWAEKGERIDASKGRLFMASESGVVRMLGGTDEGGFFEYGLCDDPKPKNDWQLELQKRLEVAAWSKAVRADGTVHPGILRSLARHISKGPKAVARVFSDNNGEGGEWIVTIPLAQLEQTAELMRQLEPLFPSMTLTGPANTYPFLTTGVQPFIHNNPIAGDLNPAELPKSVPVTGERSITPRTFTVNLPYDLDAIEDALVDFVPIGNNLVARGLVDGFEDAMVNADSAASHGDTGFATWNPRARWQVLNSALDHRRGFIGLRQRAFDVDASVSTAVSDFNGSQDVRSYMGALAGLSSPHGLGDVIYLTSPEHFLAKIITDTNLLTVDKYGAGATIVTGEVGRIGGKRLILSEFVTSDLAATGLFTGTGALTCMLIVNLSRFRVARRRSLSLGLEVRRTFNTGYIVASERKTLHSLDGNSVANVRNLINLSSS